MKTGSSSKTRDPIHTGLVLADVDAIKASIQQLLSAAVLLQLGLEHMDDEAIGDPDSVRVALLTVMDDVREHATLIGVKLSLAGERGGAR